MSNTIIQIKRSQSTIAPTTLQYGELAYSFNSNTLFIGTAVNSAIEIAGSNVFNLVNGATELNTASTIVKRDSNGNFAAGNITGTFFGNANTASKWLTARNIGVSGDATGSVAVDGSADANISLTLANSGVVAGTYGGDGQTPIFNVDSKGRLTYAGNTAAPSSSFTISGNTGTDVFSTGGTLTFEGSGGIFTTVSNDKVSINVDSSVMRTTGDQTIAGNLTLTGDLSVLGNTTTIDVSTINVEDSLIRLANNNLTSDAVDIGFYGAANPGTLGYYGIARTVSDSGNFFVFKGLPLDPTANTISVESLTFANTGTLRSSLTGGNVSGLNNAIAVTDGGTGIRSVTTGDILFANNTNTLTTLAAAASGNVLISGATPSWNKVGLTTHVTGTLGISNGGTNNTAIGVAGSVAWSDGTRYNFTSAGTSGQALFSNGSDSPIFGTLDLRGGGLGITTLNANSALFYSGSGNIISYTNTATDGQVMQFDINGGMKFGMLDAGTF